MKHDVFVSARVEYLLPVGAEVAASQTEVELERVAHAAL